MDYEPGSTPLKEKEEGINIYENDEAYLWNDDDKNVIRTNIGADPWEYDELNQNENNAQGSSHDEVDIEESKKISSSQKDEDIITKHSVPISRSEPHILSNAFVSIDSLSKCQSCNEGFNKYNNIPYLFKCNHFFCKECVQNYFTEEDGIKCPIDGLVAMSISQLKVWTQLIEEKPPQANQFAVEKPQLQKPIRQQQSYHIAQEAESLCPVHKNQKLTHFVEDTREIICVYCAFNKIKSNPKIVIKEITEKCKDYILDIEVMQQNHQHYVETWQKVWNDIQSNKDTEEQKITGWYDKLINYLVTNKANYLNKWNDFYNENRSIIMEKLDYLADRMETEDKIKRDWHNIDDSSNMFNDIVDKYNRFIRDINDKGKLDISINEYNFAHDDENKTIKNLNNFADLKSRKKVIRFNSGINAGNMGNIGALEQSSMMAPANLNRKNKMNIIINPANVDQSREEMGNPYKLQNESLNASMNKYITNPNYKNQKSNFYETEEINRPPNSTTNRQLPKTNNSKSSTSAWQSESKLTTWNKYTYIPPKEQNLYEFNNYNFGNNYENSDYNN